MNAHQILPILVVIAVIAGTSDGAKCWTCDATATSPKKCTNVATFTKGNSNDEKACPSNGEMCVTVKKGDKWLLGCQQEKQKDYVSEGCYKMKDGHVICYCNSDYCNGAAESAPALILIAAVGIATIHFLQ